MFDCLSSVRLEVRNNAEIYTGYIINIYFNGKTTYFGKFINQEENL